MKINRTVKSKFLTRVRGVFTPKINWESRNVTGDWTQYYGKWFNQRPEAMDLFICWNVAACEVMETQLQFLKATNRFSAETLKWFKDNGYIDSDGDFFLSRRFIAILSGVGRDGNDEAEAWRLAEIYGQIPNSMLPYTSDREFFDPLKITKEMLDMGQEFLKRVSIQHEELGRRFTVRDKVLIQNALFQAPLQIGIPVPTYVSEWNNEYIKWDGGKVAAHSVEVRGLTDKGEYEIFDSYNPPMKVLSGDYYIPIITRGIINAKDATSNPVSQETLGAKIWRAIWEYFNRLGA